MANVKLVSDEEEGRLFTLQSGKQITDPEISAKMRKIAEKKPEIGHPVSGVGYAWDESGMAQLFAECYITDTRFCPEAKSWYTYSAGAWRKDVGALLVSAKLKEFYQLLCLYCGEISDDELRTKFMKFVLKIGDRRFRDRILKDASDNDLLTISASRFDANPYLINCLNGTYDLKHMTFREADWHDYLTMQTNFEFTVQDVRCERWETFVSEVTEGNTAKAEYIQKAMGYSIFGDANEECMFILHGKSTRNGKSTMLSAIHHLLGDYASVSPVSIICKNDWTKDAETANPILACLKGKRFVTMAESNEYGKFDEETIKQITGGEMIKTRNLYENPTEWKPQFTLWLSCNDLPAVSDKSLFASDRLRVIEFNRHFSPEEQDKNLKTLFQTKEAMQGIFQWLIEGYFKYKRYGLEMPKEMQRVVSEYKRDNDLVLQFLEEKCEKTDKEQKQYTKAKLLYDNYKMWCKSNGFHVCSAKKFYAELEAHPDWHSGKKLRDGYPVYRDLILKGSADECTKTSETAVELPY